MRRVLPLLLVSFLAAFAQQPGQPLPAWTKGTLDIHQIQTGRGNAALFVFPDGTTLLLDAGAVPERAGLGMGPARPDATKSTAQWIAEYVERFGARTPASLDYAIITHFHDDHMGALAELAKRVPIHRLIDRGLDPAPSPFPGTDSYLETRQSFGPRAEAAVAGRTLLNIADVELRVVAANGNVWTGNVTIATSRFPKTWAQLPTPQQPNENERSIALRLRYGRFTYYTGGDLPGVVLDELPDWHDLETPVAKVVGKVDVAVLDHHGWLDTTNPFFLKTLDPHVVVIPAWHATHPDHSVMRRLRSPAWKPQPPDLYITTLLDVPKTILSYLKEPFKSTEGHIVIRVEPGGERYRVIVLDDSDPKWLVKQVSDSYPVR